MGKIDFSQSDRVLRDHRGSSAQDLIHRDGQPVPEVFATESPCFLGDADIDFDRYTSQDFFDLEMKRMWPRVWQWACREEHVAEPGDYYVYEIGPHSVIVVRNAEGEINAFVNSCLHRGTKLRRPGAAGALDELRCPFHGWTWTLDGALKRVPCRWDVPQVEHRDFSLPRVHVGLWGGFVFVNLDPAETPATPLDDYLQPLQRHFANFDMERRYVEIHVEKELYCNWKAAIEAFVENYHTQETHPQLLYGNADEGTQYDIFTPTVSRFLTAFGESSPHLDRPLSEQELLDTMLVGDRSLVGGNLAIGAGESARTVMARVLRTSMQAAYGADMSRFTDTEMIDVSQYGLFPNMILFPQLSLPMVYRFRPIGDDPNRTLFELLILRPSPDEGERPDPADPVRITEEQSFTTVPGFDPTLGHVYDQDTDNLRSQQEGFHAARKRGQTLLNYQEVRVRHLHQTLDTYLQP